jgi:hypothetical protein
MMNHYSSIIVAATKNHHSGYGDVLSLCCLLPISHTIPHETMLQAHAKDHEILVTKVLNMFGRELKSFFCFISASERQLESLASAPYCPTSVDRDTLGFGSSGKSEAVVGFAGSW